MELRQLKSFVAVAERLSFIQAARHLHLSQPALSTQIQVLEADMGVQLLERNRRSVRLTAAGEVFLRDAQSILLLAERAQASALRVAAGEEGRLRIGFVASAALDLVPLIVLAFRKRHPRVRLELLNIRTATQVTSLEERSIDAGYLRLPAGGKGLSITPIHRERFVVALPKAHRLAKAGPLGIMELEHESFVAYGRRWAPGFYDRWVGIFTRAGFSPTIVQETGEMDTMFALVRAGIGVAVAPEGLLRGRSRGLSIKAMPTGAPLSEIGLALRSGESSPLLDSFVALSKELGEKMSQGG